MKIVNLFFLLTISFSLIFSCGQNQTGPGKSTEIPPEFKKPDGVSFVVDEVEIADSLLKTDPAGTIFENKIGKTLLFMPEEQAGFEYVYTPNNGLIQTVQECYDNHRPLILTPDVIWLAICQGVSIHINEHYDSLKNIIFTGSKPNAILIRNDSLEYGGKHWKNLISSFSDKTREYTRDDFYSFFVSDFSTTTAIEKTAYQVTLLESYKKGFTYIAETGCGIPNILIAGKTKDWQLILSKLDMLGKIGLSDWAQTLRPVIIEFINASENKINSEFWKSIYKNAEEYNAFFISGWIIKFFPYVKLVESEGEFDQTREEKKVGEVFVSNQFLEGDQYLLSTLSTDNFPSGVAKIPVIWVNYFKNYVKDIEVYSGFLGIKQYSDKSLEPLISWVIAEKNAGAPTKEPKENQNLVLKHNSDYWSPHLASSLTDSAVYNVKRFQTQSQSLSFLRNILLDTLQKHPDFKHTNFSGDTVTVEILANGAIGRVRLVVLKDKLVPVFIRRVLSDLPDKWFPALAHPTDVLDIPDSPESLNEIKIRVNSQVRIGF